LASGFAAVGIGELLGIDEESAVTKIILGGSSVLVMVLCVILYSAVKSEATGLDSGMLVLSQVILFVASATICTACVAVGGAKNA
jgi:choline-glycine betaine transporter